MTTQEPYIPAPYDADCAPDKGTYEYHLLAGNPVRVWRDAGGNELAAEKLDRDNPGRMKLANILLSRLFVSDEVERNIGKDRFVTVCRQLEQEHRSRLELKKSGSAEAGIQQPPKAVA